MQPSILIYNPRAGRWSTPALVDSLVSRLTDAGLCVEAQPTNQPGHATKLARRAADLGAPSVFAFGGDGTLREVAAGLLGTATSLGPLPGGTTNVVVQALGLPTHPLDAASALAACTPRPTDVGRCGEHPFLMQVSIGVDAHVLARAAPSLKRWLGKAAVGAAGLLELGSYRFPDLDLVADGHPIQASFAAVANLALYGGPFQLVPDARPDDDTLWLLLFSGTGARATLGFAADLVRRRHTERADVNIFPVKEVVLPGEENLVQMDGDAFTVPSVTVRMAEEKLSVLRP